MDKKEFSQIRRDLEKTQKQMAQLLGTSLKAIQSFEQGWREIPLPVERQALFLMALKSFQKKSTRPCWVMKQCSEKTRLECPAWEFQAGYLCWFINGTFCGGKVQKTWVDKMKICRQCTVFVSLFAPSEGDLPGQHGAYHEHQDTTVAKAVNRENEGARTVAHQGAGEPMTRQPAQ